jgi:hypothetical protein
MSQLTSDTKAEMLRRGLSVSQTKVAYCEYDKRRTLHEIVRKNDLVCLCCGSARLDKIQGFDAALM